MQSLRCGGRSHVRTPSPLKFPANREKYREFCGFGLQDCSTMHRNSLIARDIGAGIPHQPCHRNRELSGAYQGIEFPVRGEEQAEAGFDSDPLHLDLYRVKFEVNNLKPFACLAFLHSRYLKTPQKRPTFGDELVTSFFCSRGKGKRHHRQ